MKNSKHIEQKISDTMQLLDQIKPVNGSDLYKSKLLACAEDYADGKLNKQTMSISSFKPFVDAAAVLFILLNVAFIFYTNESYQQSNSMENLDEYMDSFYNHYSSSYTSSYYELLQE